MTAIQLKTGEYYEPEQSYLIEAQRAYPNCDVYAEVNAMRMWCESNPSKRKTARGIKRFMNNWLSTADKKNGSPFAKKKGDIIKTRDIPFNDMLTDTSWAK